MARVSPLREDHAEGGARFAPYGPPEGAIAVVDAFDAFELEYAAIRKGAGLFDEPHMGAIEVLGSDRLDFLDRMLTQQLRELAPGRSAASFWLNRQGRIVADICEVALDDRALLAIDAHAVNATIESLGAYLFTEDVELIDATQRLHRFSLHGPTALQTLHGAGAPDAALARLGEAEGCAQFILTGADVVAARVDLTGEAGVALFVEPERARAAWRALAEAGAKPVGWRALNTARVEAGSPLFLVDFGADSLPHETGVVHTRVSFNKGCYLGQEVVARMESRGKFAKRLTGLKLERVIPEGARAPAQPMTGDPVRAGDGERAVGAITSSVVSPMLGDIPVCFAMMKTAAAAPGAEVVVEAQGQRIVATVQAGLRFWPAHSAPAAS